MLEKNGWWLECDRCPHTIYTNGKFSEPIPRHKELNETLVKAIIKRRELK
jgi:predicted RNA binding protein YcfA (HicA-like mRNA interferase family)